jgi:hypothetical protein
LSTIILILSGLTDHTSLRLDDDISSGEFSSSVSRSGSRSDLLLDAGDVGVGVRTNRIEDRRQRTTKDSGMDLLV